MTGINGYNVLAIAIVGVTAITVALVWAAAAVTIAKHRNGR